MFKVYPSTSIVAHQKGGYVLPVVWLQPLHPSTKWFPNCHGATVPPPHHHQLQPEIGTGLTSRDAIWVGRYWSMGSSGIARDHQGCCLKIYVIVPFFWRIFLSLPINLLLCKHHPSTDFKIFHELLKFQIWVQRQSKIWDNLGYFMVLIFKFKVGERSWNFRRPHHGTLWPWWQRSSAADPVPLSIVINGKSRKKYPVNPQIYPVDWSSI